MRIAAMIDATNSSILAEPGDTLRSRLSLYKRERARRRSDFDNVWRSPCLKQWSIQNSSSTLVVHASFPNKVAVTTVGTLMAQFVQDCKFPVLLALQSAKHQSKTTTTLLQVLKFLAMQAMKLSADAIDALVTEDFNASRLQSATTHQQWQQILARVLEVHAFVYIMVDIDLLCEEGEATEVTSLLCDTFADLAKACNGTIIKVILMRSKRIKRGGLGLVLPNIKTLNLDKLLAGHAASPQTSTPGSSNATAFRSRLRNHRSTQESQHKIV